MDRNFYYIGIAFFGMINGLFNQVWLLFALIHVQVLAPALFFGSVSLTLMFASLMVSTATIILGGIPAAIYERFAGAKDDSTETSLWIWLAGTAHSDHPRHRQFLQVSGFDQQAEPGPRSRSPVPAALVTAGAPLAGRRPSGFAHSRDLELFHLVPGRRRGIISRRLDLALFSDDVETRPRD